MVQVVVDSSQAKQILESEGPIEVVGPEGAHLGYLRLRVCTPEQVREAVQRAEDGGPWYTTEQVLEHLRSLDQK